MRRVFILFISFLACLCCLDVVFGSLARPLLMNEPDAGNNHSNLKQALFDKSADLLVMGASKSNHHYITDSLVQHFNMSVFNTGIDGDNIVTTSIQFKSMSQRHCPQIVILDLSAGQLAGDWKSVLLSHKCYYGVNKIYTDKIQEELSLYERIKLNSSLFRLNEAIPDLIKSYVTGDRNCSGFSPLIGSSPNLSHIIKGSNEDMYEIGEEQGIALNQIVKECKDNEIELFIVYSPTLITYDNRIAQAIGDYCGKNSIPFFNYEGDPLFINHPDYFKDYNHLNLEGAKVFTHDVIKRILAVRDGQN